MLEYKKTHFLLS